MVTEKRRAAHSAWRLANPDYWRRRLYGLKEGEFAAMLASQEGRCAICRVEFGDSRADSPLLDHDHASGRNRGLLCRRCNTAIGGYERLADFPIQVALYLAR